MRLRATATGAVGLAILLTAVTARADVPTVAVSALDSESVFVRLEQVEAQLASMQAGEFDGSKACGAKESPVKSSDDGPANQLYAGFAFVWAKPFFKESFQATSFDAVTNTMQLIGYDYDFSLAPRLWLGVHGSDGLGLKATYWQFDQAGRGVQLASDFTTFPGAQTITKSLPAIIQTNAPGQLLETTNSLEAQTLDIEGTVQLEASRVHIDAGAGVRYAMMDESNDAWISANGAVQQRLSRRRQLEAFGPTLSLDITRPIRETPLAIQTGLRNSVLFGNKTVERFGTGAEPESAVLDQVDDFTFIFDVGVGVQWTQQLGCSDLILRAGYEGSFWIDGGEPVLTLLGFEGLAFSVQLTR